MTDERGLRWDVDGELDALLATIEDGLLQSEHYPDALRRVWAALNCPTSGDVLLSAEPAYEFPDWGSRAHVGGGSHGSLHRVDSLGALLFCGVDARRSAPARPVVDRRRRADGARPLRRWCQRELPRTRPASAGSLSAMTDDAFAVPVAEAPPRRRRRVRLRGRCASARNWLQLIRFGCVGASGYAVNLVVFTAAVHGAGFGYVLAAVMAFIVALTNNFFWNRAWTFRAARRARGLPGGALRRRLAGGVRLQPAAAVRARRVRRRRRRCPRRRSRSSPRRR